MTTKAEKENKKAEEIVNEETVETQQQEETTAGSSEENEATTEEQPSVLQSDYDALNEKYLRLYSDFENFRKRTIKEKADIILSASTGIIKEILPVVDDFERALEANKDNDDAAVVKEGMELISSKLMNILTQKGLKPMDSKEKDFNTDWHEAITNIPAPTEELKGKVVDVVEKGYLLNDKVVRFAKVVVGQ